MFRSGGGVWEEWVSESTVGELCEASGRYDRSGGPRDRKLRDPDTGRVRGSRPPCRIVVTSGPGPRGGEPTTHLVGFSSGVVTSEVDLSTRVLSRVPREDGPVRHRPQESHPVPQTGSHTKCLLSGDWKGRQTQTLVSVGC